MLLPYLHLLTLTLAFVPSFVSAALYPKNSMVKMIDARAMVPEYSKAALGLHPLIPAYAIDCDENRSLCAEQGVKGYPTVKLFPRGKEQAPIPFQHSERTASAFFYFATRRVPNKNKKLYHLEEIEPWVNDKIDRTRVMLLSKAKDVPLMDRKGKSSVALGYEAGTKKESKVLIYPAGSTKPVLFEGALKYDSISKFFDSILDGTPQEETYEPTPEEEEIERKQEAQRLELLHGGFSDMIDFEEAIKKHGSDFHGADGYGASLGDLPKKGQKMDPEEHDEGLIYRAIRLQREKEEQEAKEALKSCTPKTDDAEQVVLEACTADDTNDFPTGTKATQGSSTEEPDPNDGSEGVASSTGSIVEEVPVPEKAAPSHAEHIKDEL
ncbi:hypothetical protein EI94DRAFT_1720313 [Lactarius quietus]|nr:hypothetical protein EI94DRAFT_1720313 [Lactarius quietus]